MHGEEKQDSTLGRAASLISWFKKQRFLRSLSEDDFRDRVVRPLFLRRGLKDGRDLCGPDEEGKDAVFLAPDPLGGDDVVVLQTKKGNLTLASTARDNLNNAVAQLRTALETPVVFLNKQKRLPSKVILCASGKINDPARKYIADQLKTPTLRFSDAAELIPQIDEHYPELWLDIDAEVLPYMRALRRAIEDASDNVAIAEMIPGTTGAATDSLFVELYLWRNVISVRKRHGQIESVPDLIEIPTTGILNKPERLVLILGEAGAGKSTAVRRLAYVLARRAMSADENILIPVLLRATDIARGSDESLIDAAVEEAQKVSGSSKPPFRSEDTQAGRLILLIDALDEVSDDEARKRVLRTIAIFNGRYPRCMVVLTSREYAFVKNLHELAGYVKYRVQQFSLRQAKQLCERIERKGGLPVDSSKELVRRLEQIHGMELNPLLVTVFAATTEDARRDIPANITELFKKFTEVMLGRWDASKGLSHQYQAPLKDFLLSKVAFEMHSARITALSVDEFRSRIANELQSRGHTADIDQLLDEILNRSGLLRVVGDNVEFRHLLIQEFFAGRGIQSEELLDVLICDDWWRRAVVFYFGDRPGSTAALARIRAVIGAHSVTERFTAAGTLGLALQACYLAPLADKLDGIVEVMEHLAELKDDVIEEIAGAPRFPLSRFLTYYLLGRDSVALAALGGAAPSIVKKWNVSELSSAQKEARDFWSIVGLLEIGEVVEGEKLIKAFHPSDTRLLLALNLGCYLIQHVRVSSDAQRKSAKRICERIDPSVLPLRKQVFEEYKSHLLEIRRGEITGIPEQEEPS